MNGDEGGLPFEVNGTARRIRSLAVHEGFSAHPVWTANVDGAPGCASTLQDALLFAARGAEREEERGGKKP